MANQQRLWQLQEGPSNGSQESAAVVSFTDGDTRTALHQASLAAFHMGQDHHQWVCPWPWSYPTLMKFNNSAENVPCGGSLYPLQGHSQKPASQADRTDLFPFACPERTWTVGRSLPWLWRKGQGTSPSGWGPLAGCCSRLPGKPWEGLYVALTLRLIGWSGLTGCYYEDPPPPARVLCPCIPAAWRWGTC